MIEHVHVHQPQPRSALSITKMGWGDCCWNYTNISLVFRLWKTRFALSHLLDGDQELAPALPLHHRRLTKAVSSAYLMQYLLGKVLGVRNKQTKKIKCIADNTSAIFRLIGQWQPHHCCKAVCLLHMPTLNFPCSVLQCIPSSVMHSSPWKPKSSPSVEIRISNSEIVLHHHHGKVSNVIGSSAEAPCN